MSPLCLRRGLQPPPSLLLSLPRLLPIVLLLCPFLVAVVSGIGVIPLSCNSTINTITLTWDSTYNEPDAILNGFTLTITGQSSVNFPPEARQYVDSVPPGTPRVYTMFSTYNDSSVNSVSDSIVCKTYKAPTLYKPALTFSAVTNSSFTINIDGILLDSGDAGDNKPLKVFFNVSRVSPQPTTYMGYIYMLATTPSLNITDAHPLSTYQVTVTVINGGNGQASVNSSLTTLSGYPYLLREISAANITARSMDLDWNGAIHPAATGALSYTLTRNGTVQPLAAGAAKFSNTGLLPYQFYTFVLCVSNSLSLVSCFSFNATTLSSYPTILASSILLSPGYSDISISGSMSATWNGPGPYGYKLVFSKQEALVAAITVSSLAQTLSGLETFTTYLLSVYPTNRDFVGLDAYNASFTTLAATTPIIGATFDASVARRFIYLELNSLVDDPRGGYPIKFSVQYLLPSGNNVFVGNITVDSVSDLSTGCACLNITNLNAFTLYSVTVTVYNKEGFSSSAVRNLRTLPGVPQIDIVALSWTFERSTTSLANLIVNWTNVVNLRSDATASCRYIVTATCIQTTLMSTVVNATGITSVTYLKNLYVGALYTLNFTVVNDGGVANSYIHSPEVQVPFPVPTFLPPLLFGPASTHSVDVVWNPASWPADHANIMFATPSYRLYVRLSDNTLRRNISMGVSTTVTLLSLPSNTTYIVQIEASYPSPSFGSALISGTFRTLLEVAWPTVSLSISPSRTFFSLSWTAPIPAVTEDGVELYYRAMVFQRIDSANTLLFTRFFRGRVLDASNLSVYTEYIVAVSASLDNITFTDAPLNASIRTLADNPMWGNGAQLTVTIIPSTALNASSVRISWPTPTLNDDPATIRYMVYMGPSNISDRIVGQQYEYKNFPFGTYTFSAKALNSVGESLLLSSAQMQFNASNSLNTPSASSGFPVAVLAALAVIPVALLAGFLLIRRRQRSKASTPSQALRMEPSNTAMELNVLVTNPHHTQQADDYASINDVDRLRSVASNGRSVGSASGGSDTYSLVGGDASLYSAVGARGGPPAIPSKDQDGYARPSSHDPYVDPENEYSLSTGGYAYSKHAIKEDLKQLTSPYASVKNQYRNEIVFTRQSLGSGQFGAVEKALVPGHWSGLGSRKENERVAAAVKMLKTGADAKSRKDFDEEALMMKQFNHANIVRVLAVFNDVEPHLLVLEFLPYGDLRGLLRKCLMHTPKPVELVESEFLHIIVQIAAGMDYLGSIRFVHRDLAARNCLVGPNLTVKISDFGLSRVLKEESDYYRVQNKGKLPIKWMAPESLFHRVFTSKSDVWSFGVTVWEVFEYGRPPYPDIETKDMPTLLERGMRLVQPATCSTRCYSLLLSCFNFEPQDRPTFGEICLYMRDDPCLKGAETVRDIGLMVTS